MVAPCFDSANKKMTSKPRKTTNVTEKLLTEFQAWIAYACYDSPSISGGGSSMTEAAMANLMSNLCFGSRNDDPEIVCFVDQFLHGLNKFHGLYTTSSDEIQAGGSPDAPGVMLLTMIPMLHQLVQEVNVFVGKGSIEKSLLLSKSVGSSANVSGRTLLRVAKEVLCN